ncbi:MAG TPA: addiction module protein [Thermoanaerobaculia bacterium]|jgi:hypothetical protein|nr:addiction module protein [Thermoanaerobaculia bacterium]
MSLSLAEIEAEARQLSSDERSVLISHLLRDHDSENPILPEIAEAWADEAERRDLEMERGELEGIPLEEVIRQARALLR